MDRVNIGCGQTFTAGWKNYDNSLSVRVGKYSLFVYILSKLKVISEEQKKFMNVAARNDIKYADATKQIPLPDNSVEVLYTSHMLEHLDKEEVQNFLKEAHRILVKNGIIRIVVPDLKKLVVEYLADGKADVFLERSCLTRRKPKTIPDKIKYLLSGDRDHQWMYDTSSLISLLSSTEFFRDPRQMPAGSTTILNPGNLDLREREKESIYVEAYKL